MLNILLTFFLPPSYLRSASSCRVKPDHTRYHHPRASCAWERLHADESVDINSNQTTEPPLLCSPTPRLATNLASKSDPSTNTMSNQEKLQQFLAALELRRDALANEQTMDSLHRRLDCRLLTTHLRHPIPQFLPSTAADMRTVIQRFSRKPPNSSTSLHSQSNSPPLFEKKASTWLFLSFGAKTLGFPL